MQAFFAIFSLLTGMLALSHLLRGIIALHRYRVMKRYEIRTRAKEFGSKAFTHISDGLFYFGVSLLAGFMAM